MPLVQQALDRSRCGVADQRWPRSKVLTLIHGYGSSGTGGAIKSAVQRQLEFFRLQGRIKEAIPGEEFEGRSGRAGTSFVVGRFLADHRDLNRTNPGITRLSCNPGEQSISGSLHHFPQHSTDKRRKTMRNDNRPAGDLRPVSVEYGVQPHADGSVLLRMGIPMCSAG